MRYAIRRWTLILWEKSKSQILKLLSISSKGDKKVDVTELTIEERQRRTQQGNCLAFFAVRFLIDYVEEYLQSKSNSLLASGS